jgi:enoyl-CoA hydratase/carnithine racemase
MMSDPQLEVPVIARVQGLATAAGCQLVAQCDLAVAVKEASFGVNGIDVGLFCATPSVPLSRNMLPKQAMEMLLTGDFISADEAKARGLVNRVVGADALDAEVEALVDRHPGQAARGHRHGQGPVLPAAGNRHGIGLPAGRPDHGLQHGA